MSVLADNQIAALSLNSERPMITPFIDHLVKESLGGQRLISYGLSSYGYDVRLAADDLKLFTNLNSVVVDPRRMDPSCYTELLMRHDEDGLPYVLQPPNSLMLGHTLEYFRIPCDVLVQCLGKSTMARAGSSVIATPLEPGWEGQLVLEIVNHTNSPIKIYPGQGIAQLVFHQGAAKCAVSYADRGGKYQGQTGTQDAKV